MRIALFSIILFLSTFAKAATPIDGWYSGVGAGMTVLPNDNYTLRSGIKLNDVKYYTGYHIGGRLGYQSNPLRYEADGVYIKTKFRHLHLNSLASSLAGSHTETTAAMANVYYDFQAIVPSIKPFLGIGIGYAYVDTKITHQKVYDLRQYLRSHSVFAYQAIAGLTYNFSENYAFDVAYHYVATDKVKVFNRPFQAHLGSVGVIYRFSEFNYK